MRIATLNVNGVNGRLSVLQRWLSEAAPDVVCLQELKAPQDKFPEGAIREAGYGAVWQGQKSWNGVAILAKGNDPAETRRNLPGDPEDGQSRYIEAAVNGVLIGCLYLPNGNPAPGPKFDYKLCWFERLAAYAEELVATGAPEAFQRLLAQGWTDAIRAVHPDEQIYTFWDYFRNAWGRDAGLRIDHVLLSPSVVKRLTKAGVDPVPSWR